MERSESPAKARHVGVDVGRGLAVVLMVQTHAYDAWVREADRSSFAYVVTRVLGAIPAPLFLVLAGVGIGLAEARAGDSLRRTLVRRGLGVVAWGYAVNLVYMLLEGSFRAAALLRADILHAIGLSIVTCALVLVGSRSMPRALLLVVLALAVGPVFAWSRIVVPPPLAPLAALFVDVPPYTRFPLLPLVVFCVIGLAVGRWLAPRAGLGIAKCAAAAVALAVLAVGSHFATGACVAAFGGVLSRAHPAIVLNVLDGTARALAVLAMGLAIDARAPAFLVRLGRASLFAYAFHIPFCYARFARPLTHRFDMLSASGLVLLLLIVTLLAVLARDKLRSLRKKKRTAAASDGA